MKDLPNFRSASLEEARHFAQRGLSHGSLSHVHSLQSHIDGHFRVYFRLDYFTLAEDRTEPSKSQWSTLKKHLKRVNPQVFVFKETGQTEIEGETLYYLDFGFFAE